MDPLAMTVRHVLLHVFREIAHHSGHADIIREAAGRCRRYGWRRVEGGAGSDEACEAGAAK
ncbi:DUF664 domain-containing protein [Streptomyces sp. NPDC053726]|uniref:mycothiol transferase n=2 Tax=unclassified Streptomyces TaxID=2593676 RepID=UPI0037D9415E